MRKLDPTAEKAPQEPTQSEGPLVLQNRNQTAAEAAQPINKEIDNSCRSTKNNTQLENSEHLSIQLLCSRANSPIGPVN